MSEFTKRKYVERELQDVEAAVPQGNQQIVELLEGLGNNLHLVKTDDGAEHMASMPCKFRKKVWAKRGQFLLVEPIPEGQKVRFEIAAVLTPKHVTHLVDRGLWPSGFEPKTTAEDPYLFQNNNRIQFSASSSSDSEEE